MKTLVFQITGQGSLIPCELDQALRAWRTGSDDAHWIRVTDYRPEDLESWSERMGLTPFARNRLIRAGEMTKVIPLPGEGLILDLRIMPIGSSDEPPHITVLCLKNLIVTFAPDDKLDDDARAERIALLEVTEGTTSGLLCAALLLEARRSAQEVRVMRTRIFELGEKMDRDPALVRQDEIIAVKDALLRLLAVSEEQSEFLDAFTDTGLDHSDVFDFAAMKATLRLIRSSSGFTERMAERLETRVNDLRQRYDSHQQDRLNHRLAVLTVISAIFLPLTLLAGIWGMNFEFMPELRLPWGYPAALCLMAFIAGLMLWFFRCGGWFR